MDALIFLQPVASNLTAQKMHERTRFPSQEFRQPFERPGSGVRVDLSTGIISPRVTPLTVDTFVSRASPDTKAGPGKGMSWCWGKDNCLRSFPSAGPPLLGFLASFASVAIQTAFRRGLAVISSCFSRCCSFLFPQFDAAAPGSGITGGGGGGAATGAAVHTGQTEDSWPVRAGLS